VSGRLGMEGRLASAGAVESVARGCRMMVKIRAERTIKATPYKIPPADGPCPSGLDSAGRNGGGRRVPMIPRNYVFAVRSQAPTSWSCPHLEIRALKARIHRALLLP